MLDFRSCVYGKKFIACVILLSLTFVFQFSVSDNNTKSTFREFRMGTNSLFSYLKHCKQMIRNGLDAHHVHVVLGNESCDLDSVVSALAFAFYKGKKMKSEKECVLPMLNIEKRDFPLRTESKFALQRFAIGADELTFRDDMDLASLSDRLSLHLVDHNALTSPHESLEQCVCDVIDHHQGVRPERDGCQVEIEMVGSCCTLVAETLIADTQFDMPPEITQLLYECILTDTICLSEQAGKATEKDHVIIQKLEALLGNVDRQKTYDVINEAKKNVLGLNAHELLRKDLKIIRDDNVTLAMSSITVDIAEFLKKPDLAQHVSTFVQEKQAAGVVVMTINTTDSSAISRQIGVYCADNTLRDVVQLCDTLLESQEPDLGLTEFPDLSIQHMRVFSQSNVNASRKQVLPLLTRRLQHL